MAKSGKSKTPDNTIIVNKKARHDYFLEDKFEAGVELQGWEVKSLRLKKVQLMDSYVLIKEGEAFLLGGAIYGVDWEVEFMPRDANESVTFVRNLGNPRIYLHIYFYLSTLRAGP